MCVRESVRDIQSLCVCQRECVSERERVCVCDSVSIREPLCCGSVVATGVARMGGAKALRSSARDVGRDGMCVRVREGVREIQSLCVSERVSERYRVCVCVCVCQRERVKEYVYVCVSARIYQSV